MGVASGILASNTPVRLSAVHTMAKGGESCVSDLRLALHQPYPGPSPRQLTLPLCLNH